MANLIPHLPELYEASRTMLRAVGPSSTTRGDASGACAESARKKDEVVIPGIS